MNNLSIENTMATEVLDAAFKVHRSLGPGLLESAYKECLQYELRKSGINFQKELPLPLIYEEVRLDCGYKNGIKHVIDNKY